MKVIMLCLLTVLGTVTCARMAAAQPCDDELEAADAESAAQLQFIAWPADKAPGHDDLMDPFEEKTPPATIASDGLPDGYASNVFDAVKAGRWLVVVGLLLSGLVFLLRKGLGQIWPWVLTDRGGVALVLATSFLGAVANGMAAGRPPGLSDLGGALAAAMAAIGGFVGLKRLIKPPDKAPPAKPSRPVAVR